MTARERLAAAIDRAAAWLAPGKVRLLDTPAGEPTDAQRAQTLVDQADRRRRHTDQNTEH